jgi:polysaccharide pyruvyl transferase CsaB
MDKQSLTSPDILLACGDESNNTGDEAILASTLIILKKKYPDSQITVFANDPELISSKYSVKSLPKGETLASFLPSLFYAVNAIRNCHLFIWGGGQLVQDTSSQFYIPNHIWRFFLANFFKKKVIVFAIGASPLKSKFSEYLVKSHLKKAFKISVRDKESARVLIDIGIQKEKINIIHDPALTLTGYDKSKGFKILKALGIQLTKPVIGFAPRRLFHRCHGIIPMKYKTKFDLIPKEAKEKFEVCKRKTAESLDYAITNLNAQALFIPMYKGPGQEDDRISKDIASLMTNKTDIYHLPKTLSAIEVQSVISNLTLVIGVRMHALILAASCGVPFIGLNYAHKGESFCRMMGMEEYGTNAEELEVDWLKDRITICLENSKKLKEIIHQNLNNATRFANLIDFL